MTAKSLKHKFQSAVVDAGTAGEISPNDWNDDHDLRLGGRTVTITTDTIVTGDELSLIKYNNATGVAVALAAPGGANFPAGWTTFLRNAGAGAVTITVTGATVNGGSTLILNTGNGATLFSDGTNYDAIVSAAPAAYFGPPQGRLTLQTATPVMTTTQSAKTTIYYSPYCGNLLLLYDGTNFAMSAFSELSVLTTDTTKSPAAIGVNKVNDWFVWNDAGTLRLGHGPDWTNDTTPVGSGSRPGLTMVAGVWTNQAAITNGPAINRGTYVGTTRSNASSQLDWIYGGLAAGGTAGFFGVANAYNRVDVRTLVADSTDSWTYGSAIWRASNAAGTGSGLNMRASYVDPLGTQSIAARNYAFSSNSAGFASNGIGIDTLTAQSGLIGISGATIGQPAVAEYGGVPGLGFHFVQAIEYTGAGTATFRGDNGTPAYCQTGLVVHFQA